MKNNIRIIISIGIFLIMAIAILYMIQNKENLFKHQVTITYPDKCVEHFVNNQLVSDECTKGRLLMEQQKNIQEQEIQWDDYIIGINNKS